MNQHIITKKRLIAYALAPVLGLGILGVTSVASAHGLGGWVGRVGIHASPDEIATRRQTAFEVEAKILGISVDDVKNAWASGKTLDQLAEEKGISQDELRQRMKAAAEEHMRVELQTLVEKGIITQAQADQRLAVIKERAENSGKGMRGKKGFHRGFPL